MQSEMKLALSGLLNPREGVISLFCSSSCASHHCHTSDSKLIELKMQEIKRKAAPAFPSDAEAKRQKKKKNSHSQGDFKSLFDFQLASFPCGPSVDQGLLIYMYMMCILLKPDSTKCATSTDN